MDTQNPRDTGREGFGVNLAGDTKSSTPHAAEPQSLKAAMHDICNDAMDISLLAGRIEAIAECCRVLTDNCDGLDPHNRAIVNRLSHLFDLTTATLESLTERAERVEVLSRSWEVRHA